MPKRLTNTIIVLVLITLLSSVNVAFAQGAQSDETNDLVRGCTGSPVSQETLERGGFIDIIDASVSIENSSLVLRLQTKEPIPSQASNLVSYSFALDLDGNRNTGFVGDRSPIGVFPDLGIDLWVNYSLYRGEKGDFGLLGSPNIPKLDSEPTLTSYKLKENRRVLKITVPIGRIEMKLKYAYMQLNPPWEVKPQEMNWVAFTRWAPLSWKSSVSDFSPEKHYSSNYGDCFANPLVKIVNLEEEDEETGGGTGNGGGNGDGKKEPPPPPAPPTPPS